MKNAIKILSALKREFPGHRVESIFNYDKTYCIFIDGKCVGTFEEHFFEKDFDNPEIEIKVKAPLYNIKEFLEEVECDGIFYNAVERGLKEWEEGSPENN